MGNHAIWNLEEYQNVRLDESSKLRGAKKTVNMSVSRWKSSSVVFLLLGSSLPPIFFIKKGSQADEKDITDVVRSMLQCRFQVKFLWAKAISTVPYGKERVVTRALPVEKILTTFVWHLLLFSLICAFYGVNDDFHLWRRWKEARQSDLSGYSDWMFWEM